MAVAVATQPKKDEGAFREGERAEAQARYVCGISGCECNKLCAIDRTEN